MVRLPKSFWLIAPYAAWMVLMAVLPATVGGYAVRTVVVAVLLSVALRGNLRELLLGEPHREYAVSPRSDSRAISPACLTSSSSTSAFFLRLVLGVFVGLVVFAIWIAPEQVGWEWYRRWCIVGEGGTQAVAEASAVMIAVRLIGSAFVISIAEELFFRKWLISFAGFGWMVALFAIEHDRWLVGAIAGALYGALYLRKGLGAACVAHATTNLVLGLWVLKTGQWQFW